MTAFAGFQLPQQNWSQLPHEFISALPLFDTMAEIKVVLYILRHTWGYQEYDIPKHITVDEFMHGRKRTDGTRIDDGIGMVKNSVLDGLERAVNHGFVRVEVDDSDKARIEKRYSISMSSSPEVQSLNPDVQKLNPGIPKVEPRTEKETSETNQEKEIKSVAASPPAPEKSTGESATNTSPANAATSNQEKPQDPDLSKDHAKTVSEQPFSTALEDELNSPSKVPAKVPIVINLVPLPPGFEWWSVKDYAHLVKADLKASPHPALVCGAEYDGAVGTGPDFTNYIPCAACLGKASQKPKAERKPWTALTDAMHESIPASIRPVGKPHYGKQDRSAKALYEDGFTVDRVRAYVEWAYNHDKWFCCGGAGGTPVIMSMSDVSKNIKGYEATINEQDGNRNGDAAGTGRPGLLSAQGSGTAPVAEEPSRVTDEDRRRLAESRRRAESRSLSDLLRPKDSGLQRSGGTPGIRQSVSMPDVPGRDDSEPVD